MQSLGAVSPEFAAPTGIAALSLVVSALAFKYATAKSRLEIVPRNAAPTAYAVGWRTEGNILDLRIALTVSNRGAQPGALVDGRLIAPAAWAGGVPLQLHRFFATLDPRQSDNNFQFAHPVVVAGRSSEVRFAQFRAELPVDFQPTFEVGRYDLVLEGRTDRKPKWHPLSNFVIELDGRALDGMGADEFQLHWNPAERGGLTLDDPDGRH